MKHMKILKSISLYFVYPFAMFLLGFFTHMAYIDFFYPGRQIQETDEPIPYVEENFAPVAEVENRITTDTKYLVIEYNLEEESENSLRRQIPEMYLGMTREELENALAEYELNPTLEDQEKGFLSLQLKEFSPGEIVIQKNYRPVEKTTGYYLMVEDGKIVVMEDDRKTVYLTTDIYAQALSDTLKQELIMGKYIHNMEELYGFLESYTS